MRVELLVPHIDAGREYAPGHVLDLPERQARWLIGLGAAKACTPPAGPAVAPPRPAKPNTTTRDTTRKGE
jgi:hypothetical protein